MKKIVRNAISLLLIISLLVSSSVIFVFADSTQDGTLAAGDVFYLGEYPQSRVIDDAVIASLNSINSNWISYQYLNRDGQTNDDMKYKDVYFNGKKYRGVSFTEYRLEGKQAENGYQTNQVYWFEYEPIEWVLLNEDTGFSVCSSAIDSQPYHHTGSSTNGIIANNYEHSDIRNWLCNSFVNSAFDSDVKDCILTNTVNIDIPSNDYVFLLSKTEADGLTDNLKPVYSTDYAKSQGIWLYDDGYTHDWCTRTAASDSYSIYYMQLKWGSWTVYYNWYDDAIWVNKMGVRPAVYVDIDKTIQLQKNYSVSKTDLNTFRNHRYEIYDESITWSQAKAKCENLGGHLVTVNSQEEQNFINNVLLDNSKKLNYWLGGYRNDQGQWCWVTSEDFDYTNWRSGQPDDSYFDGAYEDKLMMYNSGSLIGLWNDIRNDGEFKNYSDLGPSNFGYICEWEDSNSSAIACIRFDPDSGITAHVGETKGVMVILDSAKYDFNDVNITSSNPDVVKINRIGIGDGPYFPEGNEKLATVYLEFIHIGNTVLIVTAPDGTTEHLNISVEDDQVLSSFNQTTYMVDQWVDENKYFNKMIDNMINMEDPSQTTVNKLKSSKSFILSFSAWETAKIINNPIKILDREISQKEYYESILLSIISEQLDNKSVVDYITSSTVTNTVSLQKSFADFVKKNSNSGMDYNYLLTSKTLSKEEKDSIKEIMKGWKSSKFSEDLSLIGSVLGYTKDIYEFETTYCKYLSLLDVENSIIYMLDEMYNNCNPSNILLKGAIAEVKGACNNQWGLLNAMVVNGTTKIVSWTADEILGDLWNKVCSSNIVTICLKAGLVVGSSLSNFAFSTNSTVGKYYTLKCLCEVRNVIKQSTIKLKETYMNDRTEENAYAYVGAVDFLYGSYCLSCDYAVDYCSTGYNSIAGKILRKNDKSFDLLKKSAENCKQVITNEHNRELLKNWCYCLQDDYPELFDEVSEKIGLFIYGNLKDSVIRVSVLTLESDGTELTPPISVFINGMELEEDEDYTVTYSNNIKPGIAEVSVKGINHYEGEKTATFIINEKQFNSQIDIIKNVRNSATRNNISNSKNSFPVGSQAESSITDFDSLNLTISKEGITYLEIQDGVIVTNHLQIVDSNNELSVLLEDDLYDIEISSAENIDILYSYTTFDKLYEEKECFKYNNICVSPSVRLNSHIENNEIKTYSNDSLISPDFDSSMNNITKHSIIVTGGISSLYEAPENQWVYIEAIPEKNYKFVKWEVLKGDVEIIDENSITTEFMMSNGEIEISAIFIEDSSVVSGTTGDCIWELTEDGVLTISGNGAMGDYNNSNPAPWGDSITEVKIKNGVTNIGRYAFYACTNLRSVTIPDSVTEIGAVAFFRCIGLNSINISDNITSIGEDVFCLCTSLTNVIIPDSVTSISNGTFNGCTGLTSVIIGNRVTNIGSEAFSSCKSLERVAIPNSVTSIDDQAFNNCTSLISVTIPDSVKSIGVSVFRNCTSLPSITIPSSMTSIGIGSFDCCSSLQNISVDKNNQTYDSRNNCNAIIETKTNTLFVGCKSTDIPDSVKAIGSRAFSGCTGLTSIIIPNSVISIDRLAFSECTGLTHIVLPNSITSIGHCAFYRCTGLTSITLPNSISCTGDYAFQGCTGLTSIALPNSVTSIDRCAFSECTGLTSVSIPDSVTSIDWGAFYGCSNLMKISIPNSVTKIGDNVFYSCPLLSVYGSSGSYAQTYANQNGISFVEIKDTPFLVGDTNLDGKITISDVTEIQKHLAEIIDFSDEQLLLADTNGDGIISISDATHLQKYLAEFDGIVLGKQSA